MFLVNLPSLTPPLIPVVEDKKSQDQNTNDERLIVTTYPNQKGVRRITGNKWTILFYGRGRGKDRKGETKV